MACETATTVPADQTPSGTQSEGPTQQQNTFPFQAKAEMQTCFISITFSRDQEPNQSPLVEELTEGKRLKDSIHSVHLRLLTSSQRATGAGQAGPPVRGD